MAILGRLPGPTPGTPAHGFDPEVFFEALRGSPDPVFATDRQNRIVFYNASAERLLGFSPEAVEGARCYTTFEGGDAYGNRYCGPDCPVMQIANRGEAVLPFALSLRAQDGRRVEVEVTVLQLRPQASGHAYLVHVFRLRRPAAGPHAGDEEPPMSSILASRACADLRARRLTPREVEVLAMLAAGRATPEIAERLQISLLTARNHVQNILDKLEVHSKAEAVAFAFQKGIVS